MAKISVIVPVYNVEKYLSRCIESILSQSFGDFKLILVNDGSKDRSGEICDEYKEKDSRIEVIHQENMGLSMARNKGIESSTEEYITFIDSDDYIHKDMLQILYRNLIENKGDISACQFKISYEEEVLEDSEIENNVITLNNTEAVNKILEESNTNMIVAWGKLYKRELFNRVRYPKGKYHEDEFVTYKLLYNSEKVMITMAELYYYTQRDESITNDKYSLKRLEKLEALKETIDFFKDLDEVDLVIKARLRYLLNLQIAYYRVKYDISDSLDTLEKLKTEYDTEYRKFVSHGYKIPLRQRIMLKFFHVFPNKYCAMVNKAIKAGKKVK